MKNILLLIGMIVFFNAEEVEAVVGYVKVLPWQETCSSLAKNIEMATGINVKKKSPIKLDVKKTLAVLARQLREDQVGYDPDEQRKIRDEHLNLNENIGLTLSQLETLARDGVTHVQSFGDSKNRVVVALKGIHLSEIFWDSPKIDFPNASFPNRIAARFRACSLDRSHYTYNDNIPSKKACENQALHNELASAYLKSGDNEEQWKRYKEFSDKYNDSWVLNPNTSKSTLSKMCTFLHGTPPQVEEGRDAGPASNTVQ